MSSGPSLRFSGFGTSNGMAATQSLSFRSAGVSAALYTCCIACSEFAPGGSFAITRSSTSAGNWSCICTTAAVSTATLGLRPAPALFPPCPFICRFPPTLIFRFNQVDFARNQKPYVFRACFFNPHSGGGSTSNSSRSRSRAERNSASLTGEARFRCGGKT